MLHEIIVGGKNTDNHLRALRRIFQLIKDNNWTLNKKKCKFNKSSVKFLGLIFSSDGIYHDPKKVTSAEEADVPKSKDILRPFLGMANLSSMFIENYSSITEKLTASKIIWNFKKQFKGLLQVESFLSEFEKWGYLLCFSI